MLVEHNLLYLDGEPCNNSQGAQNGKTTSASGWVFFDSVVGKVDRLGVFVSLSKKDNQTVVARDICHLLL